MKISSKLPQFNKENALIIVAGVFEADFYLASAGEINKAAGFEFDKVKYENEKNIYLKAVPGTGVRGGLSYDNDYQKIAAKEFAKNFGEVFDKNLKASNIDGVYILAPDKVINQIPEMLPVPLKEKIKFSKEGHYLKAHPFEIIEIVKEV
ncbi:MAG TPA: hypothetical protein PLH22_01730 [Candidatus Colwellbacteria bacterium]|mgnify:CR=1 FL=1|jgi:hypothetical protein|nr:hypothetical protein [Candidatus Colwellbacteria bacterium]